MKQILFPILLFASTIFAADTTAVDTSFQRFGGVPVIAFSEETGWQLGALGMVFFRSIGPRDPGSQTDVAAIWTTKNQKRFVLNPTIALMKGDARLDIEFQYKDWPGYYWAGGNTPSDSALPYDMNMYWVQGNILFSLIELSSLPTPVRNHLELGVELDYEKNSAQFRSPDSASLANHPEAFPASAPSNVGGMRGGLGWSMQWDERDHDNWPRNGVMIWARQLFFNKAIGSDWNFIDTKLDVRGFLPTPLEGAWCMAGYWEGVKGDAPFDRMAMPDGTYHLRGLEKGRLRDRQQMIYQGEWRVPLFWRFSAAAFGEAGKVGPYFGKLWENNYHYAFGVGGRFTMNTQRKLNIRGDLAWVDGGIGMTIYYREAF